MSRIAGIDWGTIRGLHGSFDLGWREDGMTRSSIHFTGDEIVTQEEMPACHVQTIMDDVEKLRHRTKLRRPGGDLVGQIPVTLWYMWRREWERGPKLAGVLWRAFFTSKFMDRDFSKFRAGNL